MIEIQYGANESRSQADYSPKAELSGVEQIFPDLIPRQNASQLETVMGDMREKKILTNEQIDALIAALPGCKSPHRRDLLPRILKEWCRIDLEEHLSRPTSEQIRAEREQLQKVASRTAKLAEAIAALDLTPRFAVARRLLRPGTNSPKIGPSFQSSQRMDRRLETYPTRLQQLAPAAEQVTNDWVPPPLRTEMLKRYLVLHDLAAIYQWATRKPAGRRVTTDVSDSGSKPYGPFWEFAGAVWRVVFGSEKGLDHAMKTWAKGRREFGEWSPLIENMRLRHPEWRVFDP
jgi:hypothetical protein